MTRLACADTPEVEIRRRAYIDARYRYGVSFQQGLDILEGALAIGRQADVLGSEEVTIRLEAVRQSEPSPKPAAYVSKLAKIKAWVAPAG